MLKLIRQRKNGIAVDFRRGLGWVTLRIKVVDLELRLKVLPSRPRPSTAFHQVSLLGILLSRGAMHRPVRLRRETSVEINDFQPPSPDPADKASLGEEASDRTKTDSDSLSEADKDEADSDDNTHVSDGESSDESPAEDSALKGLSFGALAEAQKQFQPKSRKRKLPDDFEGDDLVSTIAPPLQRTEEREQPRPKPARTSKHAPTVLSSKHQVSRKRDVFDPSPAIKSRDPRFDPTVQASNYDQNAVVKANKNYSFLTSYQAAEILELKSQIKKAKDPGIVADLKQRVMAFENRIRSVESKQRLRDIGQQHKQKEKEMIRTGQKSKPYYLKPGEVKKLAENERLEGMGKKARDKALDRKRKREKSKESRHMPRVRRE